MADEKKSSTTRDGIFAALSALIFGGLFEALKGKAVEEGAKGVGALAALFSKEDERQMWSSVIRSGKFEDSEVEKIKRIFLLVTNMCFKSWMPMAARRNTISSLVSKLYADSPKGREISVKSTKRKGDATIVAETKTFSGAPENQAILFFRGWLEICSEEDDEYSAMVRIVRRLGVEHSVSFTHIPTQAEYEYRIAEDDEKVTREPAPITPLWWWSLTILFLSLTSLTFLAQMGFAPKSITIICVVVMIVIALHRSFWRNR